MAKNGDRPQTVKELAEALGVDPALLSKLLSKMSPLLALLTWLTFLFRSSHAPSWRNGLHQGNKPR